MAIPFPGVFWAVVTVADGAAGAKIAALFGAGVPAAAHGFAALIKLL